MDVGKEKGEGEVAGLSQLVCCLQAPVRRGLWLAIRNGGSKRSSKIEFQEKVKSSMWGIGSRDGWQAGSAEMASSVWNG